ncbi:unnamed protein product [Orchesella dallaii]|uniref:Protein piccolo n=1 Tax=Orchesella dallaii TaxID=48710 RepID=A0ABP1PLX6_9HEXA
MLPTNVMSFMKKMVSNTEAMNANQFIGSSNTSSSSSQGGSGGALGRLRQSLQQAQESVSNRLTQTRAGYQPQPTDQQANESISTADSQQNVTQTSTTSSEEKENQEAARPGDAGRCRVCVKAMKPDEYFKECTECSLRVCDDCASYSSTADGNEIKWRCSVCRRRGVAIIARRVQPGIEQSEVLEGLGCETTIRKSPDNRRLQNSGRADSETEVLLLAPKPSDVRRHSDVPLRDIAKFQAISAATSQHDLGLTVASMAQEKSKSSTDIKSKDDNAMNITITVPAVSVSITTPTGTGKSITGEKLKDGGKPSSGKGAPMKRQRSYERGASEGALNLPGNARGRRASCDMRGIDASSILNNNTIQKAGEKGGGIPGLSEKELQRLHYQHQQHLQQQQTPQQQPQQKAQTPQQPHHPNQQHPNQQHQQHQQHPNQQHQQHPNQHQQHQPNQQQQQQQPKQYQQQQYQPQQPGVPQQYQQQPGQQQQYQPYQTQQQQTPQQQQYQQYQQQQAMQGGQQMGQQNHPRGKAPPSDLAISNDMRRRSVQMYVKH